MHYIVIENAIKAIRQKLANYN